jgi:hypothetical protein
LDLFDVFVWSVLPSAGSYSVAMIISSIESAAGAFSLETALA